MEGILARVHAQQQADAEDPEAAVAHGEGDAEPGSPASSVDGALQHLSESTLAALAGDDPVDLQSLPQAEQHALQQVLKKAKVSELVAEWQPWWLTPAAAQINLRRDGTRLVAAVDVATQSGGAHKDESGSQAADGALAASTASPEDVDAAADATARLSLHNADSSRRKPSAEPASAGDSIDSQHMAQSLPPLPPFKQCTLVQTLCGGRAALQTRFALVQLLCAYCFTLRLYNGDVAADPVGAMQLLWHLSQALDSSAGGGDPPESVAGALERITVQLRLPPADVQQPRRLAVAVAKDAAAVLAAGRGALVCAVAHMERLQACCVAAGKPLARPRNTRQGRQHRRHAQQGQRKLHFMLCLANEVAHAECAALQRDVLLYLRKLHDSDSNFEQVRIRE